MNQQAGIRGAGLKEAKSKEQGAGSEEREYCMENESTGRNQRRAPARTFQDLEVWRNAHAFVLQVYKHTARFPKHEMYGLTSQFRRAAVSIPANIAEGFRKFGAADKARFMNMAEGSLEECRYYCILSQDLGYGNTETMQEALHGIGAQLAAYIRQLKRK